MNVIYITYICNIYIYISVYIMFIYKSIKVLKVLNGEANDISIIFSTNGNNVSVRLPFSFNQFYNGFIFKYQNRFNFDFNRLFLSE